MKYHYDCGCGFSLTVRTYDPGFESFCPTCNLRLTLREGTPPGPAAPAGATLPGVGGGQEEAAVAGPPAMDPADLIDLLEGPAVDQAPPHLAPMCPPPSPAPDSPVPQAGPATFPAEEPPRFAPPPPAPPVPGRTGRLRPVPPPPDAVAPIAGAEAAAPPADGSRPSRARTTAVHVARGLKKPISAQDTSVRSRPDSARLSAPAGLSQPPDSSSSEAGSRPAGFPNAAAYGAVAPPSGTKAPSGAVPLPAAGAVPPPAVAARSTVPQPGNRSPTAAGMTARSGPAAPPPIAPVMLPPEPAPPSEGSRVAFALSCLALLVLLASGGVVVRGAFSARSSMETLSQWAKIEDARAENYLCMCKGDLRGATQARMRAYAQLKETVANAPQNPLLNLEVEDLEVGVQELLRWPLTDPQLLKLTVQRVPDAVVANALPPRAMDRAVREQFQVLPFDEVERLLGPRIDEHIVAALGVLDRPGLDAGLQGRYPGLLREVMKAWTAQQVLHALPDQRRGELREALKRRQGRR